MGAESTMNYVDTKSFSGRGQPSQADGYGLCPGRHFPHGIGPALSGRGAGPSRDGRRVLDRPHAGDEPRVPRVRRRDGLRHLRRDRADAKDYPGALPHMLKAGSLVFTPPKHAVDLATGANGGRSSSAPIGAVPTAAQANQRARRSSGRALAYRDAVGLCALGRQGIADRSRMGIRRARRARRRRVRVGR